MTADLPIMIRPENDADFETVRRIVDDAFADEPVELLVEEIRASPGYRPELSLVAEVDGVVVGHVMVSLATLRLNDGQEQSIAMLSPLAVDPAQQRCGVGAALVKAVATQTAVNGYTFIVLEGSPDYYGRLGFKAAADYGVTMPIPDWAPPEAAQLLPLPGFNPGPDLARLAGVVIYPPPFQGYE